MRVFRCSGASGRRACKPNSVVCGHSSRRRVAANAHQRPTRRFRPDHWSSLTASGRCRTRALLRARGSLPIWSCSVWGLPCLRHYCRSGALLPHLFTLTTAAGAVPRAAPRSGGMFSVALAVHGPRPEGRCPRPGRYPAHCPVEFGLSSPGSPRGLRQRPPGPPADPHFTADRASIAAAGLQSDFLHPAHTCCHPSD